jgi:predicted  nucleic acid-binding Zn-ribbon protein
MRNWDPKLLEQLLQAQEIDLKIRSLTREIDEVYRKSKEEDPQIVTCKVELKKIEESIENAETQRHMYVDTLEDIRTAIKGLVTTKSGSPKPRTRSSTEALRIEEDKLSVMIVEIDNQIKALNEERKKLFEYVHARSKNVGTLQQGPEAEIRKLKGKIRRFEAQRAGAVKGVPSLLLRKYERLQSSRSGIVRDGVCTICRMQMPTATHSRLTYGEHIPVCPACGRIVARVDFVEMQLISIEEKSATQSGKEKTNTSKEIRATRKVKKKKVAKSLAKKKSTVKSADKKKSRIKPVSKKISAKKAPAKKAPAKKAPAKKTAKKKAKARSKSSKK